MELQTTNQGQPASFTLVVNDYGIKYTDKYDIDYLIESIKVKYLP